MLLFKAKRTRPKDQADFDAILPELSLERRTRLAELVGGVYPGHRWLGALTSTRR